MHLWSLKMNAPVRDHRPACGGWAYSVTTVTMGRRLWKGQGVEAL